MNARRLLLPFSWAFGAVVGIRNFCYDKGVFKVTTIGTPVISVGNIAAGGTGKTPLVEYIVGKLLGAGGRPAVLSRGYRRTTRGTLVVSDGIASKAGADAAGDEPAQIARHHKDCVVVVDEDRVRGALFIEREFHPDAIVLDDGFQHRALGRALDIVVLGGAGETTLLPAGDGRETLRSLGRADIVVVNGSAGRTEGVRSQLQGNPAPVVRMEYRLERFTGVAGGPAVSRDELASGRFVAFCGIGNPESFRRTLSSLDLVPEAFLAFPDHHRYGASDIAGIAGALGRSGARYALTTEKDAARLDGETMPPVPFRGTLVAAAVAASMAEGGDSLDRAVLAAAGRSIP